MVFAKIQSKSFYKKEKKNKTANKGGGSRIGSVKKVHGSRGGKKKAPGKHAYGFDGTMSDDNSISDLGTTIMNSVFLNETNEIVNKCNMLGIFFRKDEERVFDDMCELVKGD